MERLLKIPEKEGLKVTNISFSLPITDEDKRLVNNFLKTLNNKKFIALNPHAKRQTNIWPLDRFAEIGKWLVKNYDYKILVVGGKNDKERTETLKEMIGEEAINIGGKFTFLQTIELLRHCRLLISNDTGTVHMAAAVGVPVVGIYSARDFENKWYPWGKIHRVIRKNADCQICFKMECVTMDCTKKISANEVLQASQEILRDKGIGD